ncbi:MAG: hypothetical protein LBS50_04625 [Prevotellaceae bacterium]|jgi:hypothetical protein|nr:hypothetical protein [Prevotellaceae bacterium]
MKKLLILLMFCLSFVCCFSQSKIVSKFSAEYSIAYDAMEIDFERSGLVQNFQVNYFLLDRLGFYASLGYAQQLCGLETQNSFSTLICNVGFFGDIVKTAKQQRLRIALGFDYYKGERTTSHWTSYDSGLTTTLVYDHEQLNCVGANLALSYQIPICQKLYVEPKINIYTMGKYSDFDIMFGLGCSVGYNF